MSELVGVQLLADLAALRLARFEMLRGIAEVRDLAERRNTVIEVRLRFVERGLPLIAGEQQRPPSTQLGAAHVGIADERRVTARERVATFHRFVERVERTVDV